VSEIVVGILGGCLFDLKRQLAFQIEVGVLSSVSDEELEVLLLVQLFQEVCFGNNKDIEDALALEVLVFRGDGQEVPVGFECPAIFPWLGSVLSSDLETTFKGRDLNLNRFLIALKLFYIDSENHRILRVHRTSVRYSLDQTLPSLALAIEAKEADSFTVDVNPLNGGHQAVRRVLIGIDSDVVGPREISLPI
jgi:hypothetical protein